MPVAGTDVTVLRALRPRKGAEAFIQDISDDRDMD
jgi:hypothetical protein